jgi:hypothetical protein
MSGVGEKCKLPFTKQLRLAAEQRPRCDERDAAARKLDYRVGLTIA